MGSKRTTFTTSLTVAQCGAAFRGAGDTARGGLKSKVARGIATSVYDVPGEMANGYFELDDGPFAAVSEDPPAFSVGTHILKFVGGGAGEGTTLQMYVWDRGDHREVTLIALHKLTGGKRASRYLGKFLTAFQSNDATVTEIAEPERL